MTPPVVFLPNAHTLPQLARRAGISEGRARALLAAGRLPTPDSKDADDRPLWSETTIDAWCRTTNRPVTDEALWIFKAPPATEPAPEILNGLVEYEPRSGRAHQVHAIVWDTPHGHIVYVHPLVGDSLEDYGITRHLLARAALHLIKPAFWPDALVCTFNSVNLPYYSAGDYEHYNFDAFRIGIDASTPPQPRPRRLRLFGAASHPADDIPEPVGTIGPSHVITAPRIARVIGRPVPLWLDDTCTPANIRRTRAYPGTVTVEDTVSGWPAARARLEAALAWQMPSAYPAAFAALAEDTRDTLRDVEAQLRALPDEGEGWKLAVRPAAPQVPIQLELALRTKEPELPLDEVIDELHALHDAEGALAATEPHGDAAERAVEALAWKVSRERPEALPERRFPYHWPHTGPVGDLLLDNLTPAEDPDTARATRRVQRLLQSYGDEETEGIYTDRHGRYVLRIGAEAWNDDHPLFLAEWPSNLPQGWNDDTVISADASPTATGVFALTPQPDGTMHVDPVPFDPQDGPSFATGYSGGSPWTLYLALLRCATGRSIREFAVALSDISHPPDGLWETIQATDGPLRLPWPQVRQWAQDDLRRLQDDAGER